MSDVLQELESDNKDRCSNHESNPQWNILRIFDSCMGNISPGERFDIMLFECNVIRESDGKGSN